MGDKLGCDCCAVACLLQLRAGFHQQPSVLFMASRFEAEVCASPDPSQKGLKRQFSMSGLLTPTACKIPQEERRWCPDGRSMSYAEMRKELSDTDLDEATFKNLWAELGKVDMHADAATEGQKRKAHRQSAGSDGQKRTPPRPLRKDHQRRLALSLVATCDADTEKRTHEAHRQLIESDYKENTHYNRLMRASMALRPTAPKHGVLPCRSVERRQISLHLHSGIEHGGTSKVLYVSGMPGTGKTAIVLEVLEQVMHKNHYKLVHVNAMRLGSPVQIFREIADQLLPGTTTNTEARNDLGLFFEDQKAGDPVIVLLIDEVDCLVTSNQAVLYKVFDWLGIPTARLVLAAISNTMDLPERLLPRVVSRFHIERVDFSPYSKSQLYEILCCRLKSCNALEAFGDVVLRLCAARVAGASGDIRKALQICRRAVETRLLGVEGEGAITVANLEAAEKELVLANPTAQAISHLSSQTQRFLAAVVIELQRKGTDVVFFPEVASRFRKLLDIVAMDSERGRKDAASWECPLDCCAATDESAQMLAQRLEALSILAKQPRKDSQDSVLSLGSMDAQDLASALLSSEADSTIRELLEGGPIKETRCLP